MRRIIKNGRADQWSNPQPYVDANLRTAIYGKVQPMEEPSFWDRLLGRA